MTDLVLADTDRFTFTEVLTGQSLKTVAPPPAPSRPSTQTKPDTPAAKPAADTPPVAAERSPASPDGEEPTVPDIADLLEPAVRECAQGDGWAYLSSVGGYVVNNEPSFDSRNYGYAKLGQLVAALPFLEVKDVPDQNGQPHRWVRLKANDPAAD